MMEMRAAAEWLNAVKTTGLAAYLIASASCGVTAIGAADRRIKRLGAILGLLNVSLLLDIAFGWRWRLYDRLKDLAVAHQWYEQRHSPQIAALLVLAALLLAATAVTRRFFSSAGASFAIEGTLLSLACWLTEIISLHATDSILYHRVGPLMIINFVWALACLMTTIGILRSGMKS
jgi:hypothetical protein